MRPLPPICLDLARLVRRVHRGPPTGIDRVDRAYFQHFLAADCPLFGLVRTRLGFILLDRAGVTASRDLLLSMLDQPPRLTLREIRRLIEAQVRKHAKARAPRLAVARLLRQHLPDGVRYLNVGHLNLNTRVIRAIQSVPDARAIAMIHDTIPLDRPEAVTPKSQRRFKSALAAAMCSDLIVTNSAKTHADVLRLGGTQMPPVTTLPLGVSQATGAAHTGPEQGASPVFLVLGTIEPRKNHRLLLDIWQHFHDTRAVDQIPHLIIVGTRGWLNGDVFARLDTSPFIGKTVFEVGPVDDPELARIMTTATAMVFPSLDEGFGLPPMEAAAIGLPVISTDLPSIRAVLGDYPVYADPTDMYQWIKAIDDMVDASGSSGCKQPPPLPTWESHFDDLVALL